MGSMIRFLFFTTLFMDVALPTTYMDEGIIIDDQCMFDGCRRPITGAQIASFNIDTHSSNKSLLISKDHNLKDLNFDQCRVRVHSQMLNPIQEFFFYKDRGTISIPIMAEDVLDSSFTISRSRFSSGPKYRTWSFSFNTETGAEITVNIQLKIAGDSNAYSGSSMAIPPVEYKMNNDQHSNFRIRADNLILVQNCDSRF